MLSGWRAPRSVPLAAALFLASGALGLGYELVWIRKAALVVGSSQIALATVLTSFFLGLGLGSLIIGRHWRSRRWSPLFVYGFLEAGVGLFALAFPALFELLKLGYAALYPLMSAGTGSLFLLRFALLFLLFLPPTFLMGGTLPVLLDGLVERDRSVGSLTSALYGLNILGAVAGVLATGYWAIPRLGMNGTSLACGLGNLSIAAVALIAFRGVRPFHRIDEGAATAARCPSFFVVLSVASGFAAIGYQIAWARYFGLFNVANVYRTAVLLAVYLLALATGSLLLAPLLTRRVRPLRVFTLAQALAPILVYQCIDWWRAAILEFEPGSIAGSGEVVASWSLAGEKLDSILLAPLFQTALVIFLPVVLLGTGLPSLIAAATERSRELRSRAGTLVFWNTIGSSAGGFATGYVLIPWVGLRGALFALGLVSLGLAVAAEWKSGTKGEVTPGAAERARRWYPGYSLSALALLAAVVFTRDDITLKTIREYGQPARSENPRIVDVVEGPLTTSYVLDTDSDLYIVAGDVILAAVNYGAPSTQALQGHVPMLFYPGPHPPRRCLGIALGSGQSFGALLMYPIEHLDVVDISSEIVGLSFAHFAEYNHGLADDERVALWIDDGRHFVDRAPDDSYDLISMEPPPPTAEGVASLYSVEFYASVKRVLSDGGMFMQWLPLYMVTPKDLRGMLKTQAAVFPYSFVIRIGSWDFVILSFKGNDPPRFDVDRIAERARIYGRERLVARGRWQGGRYTSASVTAIVSSVITGPGDISAIENAEIFHDDTQRLSYTSGDREILRHYVDDRALIARLSFAALPLTPFESLQDYFETPIPVAALDEERALTLGHFGVAPPAVMAAAIEGFERAGSPSLELQRALAVARIHDARLAKEAALEWVGIAAGIGGVTPTPAAVDTVRAIARNQIETYQPTLERWLNAMPEAQRRSPLVVAVEEELRAHANRREGR